MDYRMSSEYLWEVSMKILNKLISNIHSFVISRVRISEDRVLKSFLTKYVSRNASVLDIGCGLGHNLTLLRESGYVNITGVDLSSEMMRRCKDSGFEVHSIDELKKGVARFDVLLFSHVLEHIEYQNLQSLLESYFDIANPIAKVIICMPLLDPAFYNDVDHIKPYYPKGLMTLFSSVDTPRQYSSDFRLGLIDIRFLRVSLLPYDLRCRHVRSYWNYFVLGILACFYKLLKIVTFGLASKTTSYVAILEITK
jgi:SAM-dependent methyltransferase